MLVSYLWALNKRKKWQDVDKMRRCKVSASGNQVLLHSSLCKLPKTVERSLVSSKNTAAEASEWGGDLDHNPTIWQVSESSGTTVMMRNDHIQSACINRELKHRLSMCNLKTMRRWSSSTWPLIKPWKAETIIPKSGMKATRHQKDDPLQMKCPTATCPTLHHHICSVATNFFFCPKRRVRKHESEEYHLWPSKIWRGPTFCYLHNDGYSKRTPQLN